MQVALIGDSIRMGYQRFVVEAMQDSATVWGPEQNGGDSRNVLNHLGEWVVSRQPDVVHINCGLHDLKKEFDSEVAQVPFDDYVANVEQILTRVKRETDARVIWAFTTPVNEAWHHEQKGFDRFEADVIAANRASEEICERLGVGVNDLYAVVTDAGRDELLEEDGVHFREEGSRLLAEAVKAAVSCQLSDFRQTVD